MKAGAALARRGMQSVTVPQSNEELLMLYLSLPSQKRGEVFAPTARTAEIAGVSQRTVNLWIHSGLIQAIRIGKKYQVRLESLREFLKAVVDGD
jgi:excisionase family DNA binding protein